MRDAGALGRHSRVTADRDGDLLWPGIHEINDSLEAAAHRIESLGEGIGPATFADLQGHLSSVKGTASGIGLDAVDLIARQMEELLDGATSGGGFSRVVLDTIARGVDVMTLLVRDVGRQRGGHPPAALEEAVERLLEDVARVSVPSLEEALPPPRLRIVHRRAPAAPPSASLERTLDLVCDVGRYTGRRLGKDVIVETAGGELVVPARLAEAVLSPLEQLVRISIDYGIETAAQRKAAGKSATARVEITARVDARYLILQVADDGAELQLAELCGQDQPGSLAREEDSSDAGMTIARMFEASMPKTHGLNSMSDRGMIMDVVRRGIDDLDGFMDVYSEAGLGTRVVLRLPLTPAQPRIR